MSATAFESLDRELPLALLPVRLEARYLPRVTPTHLVVRIFPDEIHADGHENGVDRTGGASRPCLLAGRVGERGRRRRHRRA